MAEKLNRIAFQGDHGAYSDMACRAVFAGHETVPCPVFADAFAAVHEGKAEIAMIPVDNSIAGRVADIHHLLPQSGLHIIGEHFQPVHHQLMAAPGTQLADIKRIYSHVHALPQCKGVIAQLGAEPIVASDTAAAARHLAENPAPDAAVIASELAADLYGLNILKRNIEDEAGNLTRFVIMSPEPRRPPSGEGLVITSFTFRVRNIPAALYKSLGGFATNGINMTKLESYMIGGTFHATEFLADVEGHPDDRAMRLALEELAFFASRFEILGVYPAHPFRLEAKQKVLMDDTLHSH
ncbi:MAG: prephenate dehydratase [Alphaproteobacteria bacterium]